MGEPVGDNEIDVDGLGRRRARVGPREREQPLDEPPEAVGLCQRRRRLLCLHVLESEP